MSDTVATKTFPDVVNRTVYFDNQRSKKSNTNPKTRIVICYEYDRVNERLKYGATIFNRKEKDDVFNRKEHRETALKRLQVRPVIVEGVKDDGNSLQDFNNKIRRLLPTHGTKGDRLQKKITDTVTNIVDDATTVTTAA